MKVVKFFLTSSIFALLIFNFKFSVFKSVFADDDPCQQATYDQAKCDTQIADLSKQLNEAKGQEKTLQSQLAFIDGQTKLTQLKINDTNYQIDKLDKEITDLSSRIDRLSSNVDQISGILLDRIVQTYKLGNVTPIDLLFSSHGFSDLLERLKYVEVAQANDKKVLYQLQATKTAYNDQKNDKQTRQAQEEKLKKDLDDYQQQLDGEKKAKDALLRATQNNETVYQSKLQAALAEQTAILSILNGGGHEVPDGSIHQGDVIGNFINSRSACSSGAHLHFEVHKNNVIDDPSGYLSNTSVTWDNSPDGQFSFTGSWSWPIFSPIYIEQGYGMTYWARTGWYGGGPHTGIDIWSPTSTGVKAVHDGELSHGSIACGGGQLLYKKVDHGDGVSSYYLHVI